MQHLSKLVVLIDYTFLPLICLIELAGKSAVLQADLNYLLVLGLLLHIPYA